MGKRGPQRTPTPLLSLHGSTRAKERERTAPELVEGIPESPMPLDANGRRAWLRILPVVQRMRVLTAADGEALALLCEAWSHYLRLTGELRSSPLAIPVYGEAGEDGRRPVVNWKKNPLVAMQREAETRVRRGLQDFGLTPASRSGVTAFFALAAEKGPPGRDDGKQAPPANLAFSRKAFLEAQKGRA